jgi:hypothetical protein
MSSPRGFVVCGIGGIVVDPARAAGGGGVAEGGGGGCGSEG